MTKDLERRLARMAGESPSVEERLDAMLRSGAETDAPSSPKYLPGKKSKSGGSVVSKLPIEKQTDRVKNLPKANTGKIRLTMAKTPTETEYGALSLDELREEQKRLKQRISALRSANQGGLMTFTRANDQNAARLRTATEQLDEVNKQIRTVQENQKNNAAALASLAEEQKYAGMSSTDMLAQLEELKELRDAAQERANQTSRGITALPSTTAKSTRESLADARERAETDYNKYAKAYNDLLNRYYKTENEEKKAAIQQDRDMSSSYQSAQDIQADMDKVAVLMGWVGQKTGDPQEAEAAKIYLMDKYGIDQQAIDQYAISGAGGAYTPRTDGGYNNLYELYQELEAKKEQAVSDLSEGGYDYERMAGYAQMQEDAERSKKNMAQWQETANKYPVLSSIDTLLFAPVQGIDFLKAMGSNIGHSDTDDPESYVPMNSYNMDAVNYVNTVRQTVASDIEENTDWDLFGQNVASFLYQTGMSIGDSSLNLLAFGPTGALVVGGSNAAANQAKDIIDRGGTKEQAFLGGMAAGTFEAIFEKVSIDHLLATKSVTGWKSWLKETAQQAGVEASEETFTEIANILADASIMGDNSNFNRSVDAYIAQGMSQKDAQSQAFMDLIGQVVQAGVGGAVSGGAMGGTVNARNWMSHINTITRTNQDIVNRVNQRLSQPGQVMADFMDAGLPLPTAISEKARNRQAEQNNRLVLPGNEQNNTASTGETVNENGLIPLTKQAADRLSTGKNNIIAKKTSDIISFVRNALRKKGGPERLYLGTIPDAAAKFIQDETGVNVAGYTAILPGDSVQHIFKNHGTDATEAPRGQRAVTEDDIALIPQVLSNPDRVSLSPDTDVLGRNVLILEKRIGDTYITAQAVTDGRHALTTNSLWIQKEKDRPTTPDAGHKTGPEGNAQSALPQDPSIDSILPDGENVNIQEAMDDPVNRLYELLGENGRRAITHMYDGMGDMDLYVQDFCGCLPGRACRQRKAGVSQSHPGTGSGGLLCRAERCGGVPDL